MPNYANLASRYAGRPLLLTPDAALDLAHRIRAVDSRAFERPSRVGAILRRLSFSHRTAPAAMDDDHDLPPPPPLEERLAYTPRWLGEAEDTGFCWTLKDGVALMCADTPLSAQGDEFCGIVYHGYDTLLMGAREALSDARVKGLFLRLDTPGGVVDDGLRVLSAFMRSARAAAGGKPIWVHAGMACSAGYWIAAQADRIVAPHTGYVGSIGAVIVHESYAGALDEAGVEVTSIEFPDGGEKTDGAWWKALSDSAKAAWRADVEECGRLFLADVVAGRPTFSADELLATRAGVFMGDHADSARSGLSLGFVDAVAGEEETFAELVEHISAPSRTAPSPAPGSGAGAHTPKEAPMAKTAAQKAHDARIAQAEADLAKLKAESPTESEAPETPAEEDEPDEDPAPEPAEVDTAPEGDAAEAQAIAKSAEAKAHPHLANAAIASGQSLKQFQATIAALGAQPKVSSLDRRMAGAPRLGPDAGKPGAQGDGFSGAMAARAAANRAKRAG